MSSNSLGLGYPRLREGGCGQSASTGNHFLVSIYRPLSTPPLLHFPRCTEFPRQQDCLSNSAVNVQPSPDGIPSEI